MTDLEKYIIDKLKQLVPNADGFDVRVNIGDKSYSVEFFAIIDDIKYQCFDMIDNGVIRETDFDVFAKQLAQYIRTSSEYRSGEINKFVFTEKTN